MAALVLSAQDVTFRAMVPVVLVPVTVKDKRGKLVDGLAPEDFAVTDNNRAVPFQLDTADSTDMPLALVVVVQANDLSAAALLKIQKIGSMIQPLITGQRGHAAVLAVDERLTLLQDFTSDEREIANAFRRLVPSRARKVILLDAALRAAEMLRQRSGNERRVLLVLGESKDRGSKAQLPEVLEQLQRDSVQVFAGTYSATRTQFTTKASDRPKPSGSENDILAGLSELVRLGKSDDSNAMAVHTGGRKFPFATLHSLEEVVTQVGEDVHGQYLLSFAAGGPEGFHAISVQLREPAQRTLAFRQGYWAVAKP